MSDEAMTIYAMRSSSIATHKRFLVAPEEEIQGIEVRGAWKPSDRTTVSNPSPGICSMEVVTHHNRKMCWCTIMYELQVLVASRRRHHVKERLNSPPISGNEKADRLAKAGSLMFQPDSPMLLRDIKRLIYCKLQINSLQIG
ncbi:uncharacterized protein TNCV_2618031 [Trichonephila clavipes]|nr:uncharacterized protein TNCV_2618031 [Trichonephila clavipes]